MMSTFSARFWLFAAALLCNAMLGACSQKNGSFSEARLNLRIAPRSQTGTFSTLALSNQYCYAVMVSAESPAQLNRHTFNRSGCSQPERLPKHLGLISSLTPLGGTLKMSVPSGASRRIDLYGFKRVPSLASADAPPESCEGSLEVLPPSSSSNANPIILVGGVKRNLETRLIATKTLNLNPGLQDVVLDYITDEHGISTSCGGASGGGQTSPGTSTFSAETPYDSLSIAFVETTSSIIANNDSTVPPSDAGPALTISDSTASNNDPSASGAGVPITSTLEAIASEFDLTNVNRNVQVNISPGTNQSTTCSVLAPNASFFCSIGAFTYSFSNIFDMVGPLLQFVDENDTSAALPVRKYVIRQVSNINEPAYSDEITDIVSISDNLYFSAWPLGDTGSRLFRFNPTFTPASISRVLGESRPEDAAEDLTLYDYKIYFGAKDASGNRVSYRYNPNSGEVSLFTDASFDPDLNVTDFAVDSAANNLYFAGVAASGDKRLMRSNANIIERISDISPPGLAGGDDPRNIQVHNSLVFFSAQNSEVGVRKLFVYNPSANLFSPGNQITRISETSESSTTDDNPRSLRWASGKLYFVADNSAGHSKLFAFNPSNKTTVQVSNISDGVSDFAPGDTKIVEYAGALYFSALTSDGLTKIYRYNLAQNTIQQISNLRPGQSDDIGNELVVHNGALYFAAASSTGNSHLYRYSSIQNRLERVSNIRGAGYSDSPKEITSSEGHLYFVANSSSGERKLFRLTEE